MRHAFERRGHTMVKHLAGIAGVEVLEPQGAFYAFPDLSAFLGRSIRGRTPQTTVELCGLLLDEVKVAVVPGEAFGTPGYARLSFALGDDDLGEGCRRIADLLGEAAP
jgi:aspartate/methionine/tyrosine aminotransferase